MKTAYCPHCGGMVEPIQYGDIILRYLDTQKDYPGDVKEGEKIWEKYTPQRMIVDIKIPPATFYRGLKALERYGLIMRVPLTIHDNERARRLSLVVITPAGREAVKSMNVQFVAIIKDGGSVGGSLF